MKILPDSLDRITQQFSRFPGPERFDVLIDVSYQVIILPDSRSKNSGIKIQVLFNCKVLVKRKSSRHISRDLSYFSELFHHIIPHYSCRTCKGFSARKESFLCIIHQFFIRIMPCLEYVCFTHCLVFL